MTTNIKYERGFWYAGNQNAVPTDFDGAFLNHGKHGKVFVTSPGDFISFADRDAHQLAVFQGSTYWIGERELAMLEPLELECAA